VSWVDGGACELPQGLWELLVDGGGDGRFDAEAAPAQPHSEIHAIDLSDYGAGLGYNLAYEDRRDS
jgi:hypothetical protein